MNSETRDQDCLVLIIEDEKDIRRFIRASLEANQYQVVEARDIRQGLIEAGARKPHLVILDLGLPDGNGVEFVHEYRHWSRNPVLVLSARTADQEKIKALDAGADDYLTKPFAVGELLARLRALMRRSPSQNNELPVLYAFADVCVDLSRRQVTRAGQPVHLTPIEYDLLALLLQNAGKVLTHRNLLKQVWGSSFVDSNHYLRVYVGHLRQKLEVDPAQPKHLLTEIGVGYRFNLQES